MRSNIIQMLLNASSGKGGSSPVKPESKWTIVHFLFDNVDKQYSKLNRVAFKVKTDDGSNKYYYVRYAKCLRSGVFEETRPRAGCYGFADLLDFQTYEKNGNMSDFNWRQNVDKINFSETDPDGRPMVFMLANNKAYLDNNATTVPSRIFSWSSEWDSYSYGAFRCEWYASESRVPEAIKFPNNIDVTEYKFTNLFTVGIKVPPSKLDSVMFAIPGVYQTRVNLAVIQNNSSTPEELQDAWLKFCNETDYKKLDKTDFSKDRLMKLVKEQADIVFYSETDIFGLTLK